MLRSTRRAVVNFLLLTAACGDVDSDASNDAALIGDRVACRVCRIIVDTVVTLRVPRDSTDGFPLHVRADSAGRYWLFRQGELPAVFSAHGAFLRTIGRAGQGPGEYTWAYDLMLLGRDTVLVIDTKARRVTVMDTSLNPVGFLKIPGPIRSPVVFSWPGQVLVNAGFGTPESAGWPLHLLAFDQHGATVSKSFGVGDGELRPGLSDPRHELTPSPSGGFWAASAYVYDLSEWSRDGTLRRVLRRRPSWFGFDVPPGWDWRIQPPNPHITALSQDDSGMLWVFVGVAGPEWKSAFARVPRGSLEYRARDVNTEDLWSRTVIEVIDPDRKRVIARRTMEAYTIGASDPRRIALYDVDAGGQASVKIVSFRLEGR